MPTITPHVISGDFNEAVYQFLKGVERFVPRIYSDSVGIPTLGIGYALFVKNQQTGLFERRSTLESDLGLIGLTLTQSDRDLLDDVVDALNAENVTLAKSLVPVFRVGEDSAAQNRFSIPLVGETQFRPLFDVALDETTNVLRARLGTSLFSALAGSQEMEALLSLTFNNPALIGSNLVAALRAGNRPEAWFEIRYDSNAGASRSQGIASRRYTESDLFGLFENAPLTEAEAKGIFRMYTDHGATINNYESNFPPAFSTYPTRTFRDESFLARNLLVTTFAQFAGAPDLLGAASGDVLVGADRAQSGEFIDGTSRNDLMLGEAGFDTLRGLAGQDVIYGGDDRDVISGGTENDFLFGDGGGDILNGDEGNDTIQGNEGLDLITGGPGDDLLKGGPDFDTYYWNTGDGNDRIEDFEGQNAIVANEEILIGGIHRTGDAPNTFHSLDGTYTYVISGTDLEVHIGTAILTVNENFESGQFGIRLIDATEADYDANGFPSFTDIRGDGNDTVVLLGNTNYTVHGNGGDDFIQTAQGNDQLFGEAGQDTLFGNSADDRLYGGTENDFLHGDHDDASVVDGRDVLDGGPGADELVGGYGDDLLFGGDGNDTLWGDSLFKAQGSASADDFLDGGAGDDTLHGLAGNDVLSGGPDNDLLFGEEDDDVLDGGTGDDLLLAYTGNDTLAGGAGVDRLYGDVGVDILDGGSEADQLFGGDGADVLYGGPGDDQLFGDTLNNPSEASAAGAADFLLGGTGNDRLEGGIGDDFLSGEADNDVLFGQAGADALLGDAGDDELQGGADADVLSGDAGADRLFGDDGADTLLGGDDADLLVGDAGDDTLEGGAGADTLQGGAGADTYVFNLGDGTDTIDDTSGDANRVVFGTGITADSLALGTGSLRIIVATTGDEVLVGAGGASYRYI